MQNLIMFKEGENSFIRWIKKRIENNLNFLAIAEGPTGIGKSWALLSIAHKIDPDFEIRQVGFSFRSVMETLAADWFNEKKWKILIFDEAQTDIGNRQWQSLTNKLMNYLLSTFRHRNVILLFTSPYSDFLDSQSMKLMHCKLEIQSHSRKTKLTIVRPKLLQYNSKLKKFYEHSLRVIKGNKGVMKMSTWKVAKPPQHLIEPYEKAKTDFTTRLNKDILAELDKIEQKNKPQENFGYDTRKPLTSNQAETIELMEEHKNATKVAEIMNKSISAISQTLLLARNKGYRPNIPRK